MAYKSTFMSPEEVAKYWDYIHKSSSEYESWPEWKKQTFSVNFRDEASTEEAAVIAEEPTSETKDLSV